MLLVKLKNTINNKNTIKNPFFYYFKHGKLKFFKKNFKNHFFFKKKGKTEFLVTKKTKFFYKNIQNDTNTLYLINQPIGLNFSQKNIKNYFLKDNINKTTDFNFIFLTCFENVIFHTVFSFYSGVLLYKAAGGCYISLSMVKYDMFFILMRLPSGYIKKINLLSLGYIGRAVGVFNCFKIGGGFKINRLLKRKPVVRGVATNPVDHPNGGRSNTKKPFLNKYNLIAKHNK